MMSTTRAKISRHLVFAVASAGLGLLVAGSASAELPQKSEEGSEPTQVGSTASGQQGSTQREKNAIRLFDGRTFKGWEGDTQTTWRIEDGAIVAGSLEEPTPRNEFLCTRQRFGDFELRLKFKITGDRRVNGGVQFRTERIPNHHEVIGYQADIGPGYFGALYDESRRRKILAAADQATTRRALAAVGKDGWHTYRIRAEGNHVELWLNGVQTVDYREPDPNIARDGIIAIQIHAGMQAIIAYKDIVIRPLGR